MSGVKRTVLVANISYVDADGEGRVGVRGEEVTVHPDGVQHFDWLQDGTPEQRHAVERAAADAAEKQARSAKKTTAKDAGTASAE